jgi:hypothetical protein
LIRHAGRWYAKGSPACDRDHAPAGDGLFDRIETPSIGSIVRFVFLQEVTDLQPEVGVDAFADIPMQAVPRHGVPEQYLVSGRVQYDLDIAIPFVRLQEGGQVIAGKRRHVDVHQYEVRGGGIDQFLDTERAPVGQNFVSIPAQHFTRDVQMIGFVVYDQNYFLSFFHAILHFFVFFFLSSRV